MRYYEYLSDAKVEMLYPQICDSGRAGTREIGIDLKVVKVSRKSDGQQQGPSIYEKLKTVEEWIYANEPVGSIDAPEAWILGRGEVKLAKYRRGRGVELSDTTSDVALFAAHSENGSRMLMGGSAFHLAETRNYTTTPIPRLGTSAYIRLERVLRQLADDPTREAGYYNFAYHLVSKEHGTSLGECEFLAKRLGTVSRAGSSISLATPLFVSMLD